MNEAGDARWSAPDLGELESRERREARKLVAMIEAQETAKVLSDAAKFLADLQRSEPESPPMTPASPEVDELSERVANVEAAVEQMAEHLH